MMHILHSITFEFSFFKALLSPLGFFASMKAAFSLDSMIPIEGEEAELAKYPDQKLKVMSLIQVKASFRCSFRLNYCCFQK
jgi:hypothetical protein